MSNDTQLILSKLSELEIRLNNKIDKVETVLSSRINTLEKRFEALEKKLDIVSNKVETNGSILSALVEENCKINARLDKIERNTELLPQMYHNIGKTMLRVDKLEEEMVYVKRKVS